MFLFIWGWRTKFLPLGVAGSWHCAPCERTRPFQLVLRYNIFHMYWLLRAVTRRQYMQLCTVCSRGDGLDRAVAEVALNGDPVPAVDRYGLLAAGVVVGLIALAAALGLI